MEIVYHAHQYLDFKCHFEWVRWIDDEDITYLNFASWVNYTVITDIITYICEQSSHIM